MMKKIRYFFMWILAILTSCTGTLSETDFTNLCVAKLQELDPELQVKKAAPLEIEYGYGAKQKTHRGYLDNAYRVYKNGEKLSFILEKYARSCIQTLTSVKPDLNNIVPVIKDDKYVSEITENIKNSTTPDQGINFYSAPYVDGLVILYGVDTPENIRYINREEFEGLGIPEAELRKKAVQNLDRMLPEIEFHSGRNVCMITAGGNYESSVLLLDRIWEKYRGKVDGNIIAAIPCRDVLLVTGSNNPQGIAEIKNQAGKIMAGDSYALTDDLFERNAGSWVKFKEKPDE